MAYAYDGVGNQTSVVYPDGTTATKEYDLVHNLTKVIEEDGRTTTYEYDGMRRVTHMDYPDGWQEDYHYDAMGRLTAIEDTDPTQKDMKQQKNTFEYDVCGNMIHEYMRGNGTGETTTDVTYTYDELHRVTSAHELYGNAWRNYQYDSLGNLTYENNSNNVHYDYKLNNLNQLVQKSYSSNDKEGTLYTYDGRGNLILEEYGKLNGNPNGQKRQTVAEYVYDETNKMVKGVNSIGESSSYLFNGRNALVEQTWHIAKNGYGYHDVDAGVSDPADTSNGKGGNGSGGKGHGNGNGQGNGNGSGDKPTGTTVGSFSTVVKQFVIDYTQETMDPLMEHEVNGLDYRYVYGNERLSVNISPIPNGAGHIVESGTVGQQIRLYYHQDLRGTVDYLTSPVSQKVESWTHYNEWGEITHNAVLKMGQRELDLVKNYTGHDFDAVLNMYYAKARMYDAENRRFTSVDPILDGTKYDLKDYTTEAINFTAYVYVRDNPLRWVDPLGLMVYADGTGASAPKPVLYINGTRYDEFAIFKNNTTYIKKDSIDLFLGYAGIYRSPNAGGMDEPVHIGTELLYFEKIDGICAVKLRDITDAAGISDTLSWWSEQGTPTVTLNTIMSDSPVKVIREGSKASITIYAKFSGKNANKLYDNSADALDLHIREGNPESTFVRDDYVSSDFTYAELVAEGVKKYWSKTGSEPWAERIVEKSDSSGTVYDSFGDDKELTVDVNFYAYEESLNGFIKRGNPSPTQRYISVKIDTDTPTKPAVPPRYSWPDPYAEISNTRTSGWSVNNNSSVTMYDHYTTTKYDDVDHSFKEYYREEYRVDWYMKTAAHEFGHVFGLGDAYNVGWHPEATITPEVPGGDMMRSNGMVTANDVEMLLEAWKTNKWQEFVGTTKSSVIRWK